MKAAVAVLLFLGACLVGTEAGLKCYACTKGYTGVPIPGINEHKKCHEGKLPDDIIQDCDSGPIIDINGKLMNTSQIESYQRQGYPKACLKVYAKVDKNHEAAKGCTFKVSNTDECLEGTVGSNKGSYCKCNSDKCNGVGTVIPSFVVLALGVIRYLF